jgi:hypothetical protein
MTSTTSTGPGHAGAQAAHDLITALADAGMNAGRIDQAAEGILGARYDAPTPVSNRFYAAFDRTAAIYVANLHDLEAG